MEGLGPGHHKGQGQAGSSLRKGSISVSTLTFVNLTSQNTACQECRWPIPFSSLLSLTFPIYSSSPHSLYSFSMLFGAVLAPPSHPNCLHKHCAVLNINTTFTHWNPSCLVTSHFINKDQLCSEVTNRKLITSLWLGLRSCSVHWFITSHFFQNGKGD